MKYIMLDIDGLPSPVLFPEYLQHADVAKALAQIAPRPVISAGFVQNDLCDYMVHGESESLKLFPLPGDADLISLQFEPPACAASPQPLTRH